MDKGTFQMHMLATAGYDIRDGETWECVRTEHGWLPLKRLRYAPPLGSGKPACATCGGNGCQLCAAAGSLRDSSDLTLTEEAQMRNHNSLMALNAKGKE